MTVMAGEGVKVTVSVPESELGKTEEGDSERASASAGIDAAKVMNGCEPHHSAH